jgi:hypothetical protein
MTKRIAPEPVYPYYNYLPVGTLYVSKSNGIILFYCMQPAQACPHPDDRQAQSPDEMQYSAVDERRSKKNDYHQVVS